MIRRLSFAACALVLVAALLMFLGYRSARADPVVRRAAVALPNWPRDAAPITVALISDVHMESAAMDEARLGRIVAQVNALQPDLVAIAGDFVNGRGPNEALRAMPPLERALRGLKAPLGVVAVLGNHDYGTDPLPLAQMLRRIGITVLVNDAVAAGPIAIAGLGDKPTGHARLQRTMVALARLRGAGVLIAHSPDIGTARLDRRAKLVLAGHTHCGQIVLPIVGPPVDVAPERYRCGIVREPGRITIITAGLGTSNMPIRMRAPPDLWLIRLGPVSRSHS